MGNLCILKDLIAGDEAYWGLSWGIHENVFMIVGSKCIMNQAHAVSVPLGTFFWGNNPKWRHQI